MLGKIEDRKRRGRQRVRWLRGVIVSVGMRLQEMVKDREALFSAALGVTKSWTTTWRLNRNNNEFIWLQQVLDMGHRIFDLHCSIGDLLIVTCEPLFVAYGSRSMSRD